MWTTKETSPPIRTAEFQETRRRSGLLRSEWSSWHFQLALRLWRRILASLGGFSFGYDQGVISVINVIAVPRSIPTFGSSCASVEFLDWIHDGHVRARCFRWTLLLPQIGRHHLQEMGSLGCSIYLHYCQLFSRCCYRHRTKLKK